MIPNLYKLLSSARDTKKAFEMIRCPWDNLNDCINDYSDFVDDVISFCSLIHADSLKVEQTRKDELNRIEETLQKALHDLKVIVR